MADKKVSLKPCPICGCRKIQVQATVSFKNKTPYKRPYDYRVTCVRCYLQTDHTWTFAKAVKDWNDRRQAERGMGETQ